MGIKLTTKPPKVKSINKIKKVKIPKIKFPKIKKIKLK